MERENLSQARQEFIQTLEAKVMQRRKVHPLDKRALVELVSEEIANYKIGLIDQLSSRNDLASLINTSPHTVYYHLLELPHDDWILRSKVLKKQSYQGSLGKLSREEYKKIKKKGNLALTHEQRRASGIATREAARKKKGFVIIEMVYPLLVRGASDRQIAEGTDLTLQQVWNAKTRITRSPQYKKVDSVKPPIQQADYESAHTNDQAKSTTFLRELLKTGLVVSTDRYWNRLNELGQIQGIKLPESFEDRVCLESFLVTKKYEEKGAKEYLAGFIKLGMQIEPEWFKEKLAFYKNFLQEAYLLAR